MANKLDLSQIIGSIESIRTTDKLSADVMQWLNLIGEYSEKRKGVYTVLTTLLYYKYLHPEQDVRKHQAQIDGGFSGRSFDTANVTPVLKECGLPAMAESGWLTRSLEQPYPYDFKYNGKIPELLKSPFLNALDFVQKNPTLALPMLQVLLKKANEISKINAIPIVPLSNPDRLSIDKIMTALEKHFLSKYGTHGGAKLPVIAFHAIYSSLIKEIKRYSECDLADLSSLTACDRTNKASGDIEIFRNGLLYESIEIKLDKPVDAQIIRVVKEKIYKWNPQRYYVLSVLGLKNEDKELIDEMVLDIASHHGCQLIINGLLPTIKYYLRLITDLSEFMQTYSKAVENDNELQIEHKTMWNNIIKEYDL